MKRKNKVDSFYQILHFGQKGRKQPKTRLFGTQPIDPKPYFSTKT